MSKKAKTSGPSDDLEPEKTPENAGENPDIVMDDSAPQDPATDANPPEADPATHVDTSSPRATPSSPVADLLSSAPNPPSPAANPPSPAKDNVNPPSPAKDDDDVIVTGTAYTAPGNPVAKDEFAVMGKGKGRPIYQAMLIFLLRIFIPNS